jgi:hypothetical protein
MTIEADSIRIFSGRIGFFIFLLGERALEHGRMGEVFKEGEPI